jgi:N-acetylglucosamine transport system permease protein
MATDTQRKLAAASHRRPAPPSPKRDVRLFSRLGQIALVLWAIVVVMPILWTFIASFKDTTEIFSSPWTMPGHLRFENWGRAWTKAHIGRYFLNSVLVVGFSVFGTMLLGSMAAYVLARYKFWGNRIIYYLFVSGLAFPVFLALVPLFFVVRNLGLLGSLGGLIFVYAAYSLPFTVFFLTAFFRTLPSTVAEAAMVDGCGHFGLFFRVMLPMARPGLVSVGIFNFLFQWNQYVLPIVLMQGDGAEKRWVLAQGLTALAVNEGYRGDFSGLFAGMTIAMVPVLIGYLAFHRQVQSGLAAGQMR